MNRQLNCIGQIIIIFLWLTSCSPQKYRLDYLGNKTRIKKDAVELYKLGTDKLLSGQIDEGLNDLNEAVNISPNFYSAHMTKYEWEKSKEKYNYGLITINRYIKLFLNDPYARFKKGLSNERNGQVAAALMGYKESLRLLEQAMSNGLLRRKDLILNLAVLNYLIGEQEIGQKYYDEYLAIVKEDLLGLTIEQRIEIIRK